MKYSIPAFLLVLSFFIFPWLPDISNGAKGYLFFMTSLVAGFWLLVREDSIRLDLLQAVWFLWAAWWVISSLHSRDWTSGLIYSGIFFSAGIFWIIARKYSTVPEGASKNVLGAVLLIAVLAAIGGLWQFVDYQLTGQRSGMILNYVLLSSGKRINGPFGQANLHALLMMAGLCAFAHFYFFRHQVHSSHWRLCGPLIIAGLLWLNFFLTGSRGGQVGLAAVLAIFGWHIHRHRSFLKIKEAPRKSIAFISVSAAAWLLHAVLLNRVSSSDAPYELMRSGNIANRLNNWMSSLLMFFDHPFWGIGPDNYKGYLHEYQVQARDLLRFYYEDMIYTQWAHNEYLQILAEGGVVSLLFMGLVMAGIVRGLRTSLLLKEDSEKVFILLAPVPFMVQALFSWPLRFMPLVAIFLSLVAIALPRSREMVLPLGPARKCILSLALIGMVGFAGWKFYWDIQAGSLKRNISDPALFASNFEEFQILATNPFIESTMLNKGIDPFVQYAVRNEDAVLAQKLLPFQERAVYLEGVYWQWYNLSRLQLVAGDEEAAKVSIRRALDYNPVYNPGWTFLHYLDVLHAARATGRSVESFYPKGPVDLEIDHVGDTFPQRQKNL